MTASMLLLCPPHHLFRQGVTMYQAGLKLLLIPPQRPLSWDYQHVPPSLAKTFFRQSFSLENQSEMRAQESTVPAPLSFA